MKLKVNHRRAKEIVLRLQQAFTRREGLLSEVSDLVENQIPDNVEHLSFEHASFLFYIVSNDHGMKSTRLYDRAKELYYNAPDLFDPLKVLETFSGPEDERLLELTGNPLGTRYPKQTAKSWYINSEKLITDFDASPVILFQCSHNAGELLKKIVSFRGYGPKTGGMLLRAIVGLGFNKLNGMENVLVPVDIHDSRISFYTGMVHIENDRSSRKTSIDYYSYVRDIQQILLDTCNSSNISWLDVDRALWLIGSRGCVNKKCINCPLNEWCEIGKEIMKPKNSQKDLQLSLNHDDISI
ncbi:MAG: hypothetical protein H6696_14220 [Deferribacteres bacterium]|nr:hypothetical protein [candidate division KSB1 bacterium]MCB9503084.1 hypothetical protein [Deferribacteres bacterium]